MGQFIETYNTESFDQIRLERDEAIQGRESANNAARIYLDKINQFKESMTEISDLFPPDAPHKHEDTGVSLLDDLKDLINKYHQLVPDQREWLKARDEQAKKIGAAEWIEDNFVKNQTYRIDGAELLAEAAELRFGAENGVGDAKV